MTTRLKTLQLRRLIFILGVGLLVVWASGTAQAKPPVSVGLISFTATPQENGIRLDWETATEDTDGFYIKRSLNSSGPFITLSDIGFIGSEGDITTGATYSRVDETAVYGTTYTYQLNEILPDLTQVPIETATITFVIVPTATPIVIGGNNPTITPTKTPVPTSTPSPTGTVQNTAVPPTATNTPFGQTAASPTPSPTATIPNTTGTTGALPTNTPVPVIDSAFTQNSGSTGIVLAQEGGDSAYPGPDTPAPAPDSDAAAYPDGPQPTAVSDNPTPYPVVTAVSATVAVIGSDSYPLPTPESDASPVVQDEAIRGRIFLWGGFIIALLIFIGGVAGSIALYRRKRE